MSEAASAPAARVLSARASPAGGPTGRGRGKQAGDAGRNKKALALMQEHFPEPWKTEPRGTRIRDRLYLEYGDRFQWPDMTAPDQGERVFCYGLKDHFAVLCDGRIVPCCLDREGEITLGNIFTDEVEATLASPRARAMREGFACRKASEELCRRCGYARRFG